MLRGPFKPFFGLSGVVTNQATSFLTRLPPEAPLSRARLRDKSNNDRRNNHRTTFHRGL
jgi:hypothetical protein